MVNQSEGSMCGKLISWTDCSIGLGRKRPQFDSLRPNYILNANIGSLNDCLVEYFKFRLTDVVV